MAITLTIAGSLKAYRIGSLSISSPVNGRTTASFEVRSNDGTYRPALDAAVVIADGATTLFGGLIDSPAEEGILGDRTGAYTAIATRINAVSYHAYTERRFVNETLAAGTLKSQLTTLVANYLTGYGVTLDAGQVNGPTLPALTYDYTRLLDVLNELSTLTGKYGNPYVWTISPTKVLSMAQPSSMAAPFNVTDGDGHVVGDLTVDRTRHQYANTIILKVPSKTEMSRVETFTGDGSTDTFTLQYTLFGSRGYVTSDGIYETLTTTEFAGSAMWTYDPTANTLKREIGAPANGTTTTITFDGTFAGFATASDAGEIASYGIWEKVVTVDSVPSDTTAQALADGYLSQSIAAPKMINYRTHTSGLAVGQTQTITSSLRNLSAVSSVITEVVTHDYSTSKGARPLVYDITLTAGAKPQEEWRDIYKLWAGDRTGGSAASVAAGTGIVIQGGPGGPNKSVQYNDSGRFGGDASSEFTYDKDTNSLVCGGGGSSITAAVVESCQVFGYDCHIADA